MSPLPPLFYALLCVVSWSFIPIVARMGQSTLSGLEFLFWTNFFSALALVATVRFKKYNFKTLLKNTNIPLSVVLGFLGGFFYYLCLYYGYATAESMQVLVIQYTWPALVSLLAVFLLGESLQVKKIFALVLGALSALLVITKGNLTSLRLTNISTLLIVFAGAFGFALFSVLTKKENRFHIQFNVFLYFFWASLFSLFALLLWQPSNAAKLWSHFLEQPASSLISTLLNGLFINGLSYLLWIYALEKSEASRIAPLVYLAPLLSLLWLLLFFHEPFLWVYFVAVLLSIVSGLLTLEWSYKKNKF